MKIPGRIDLRQLLGAEAIKPSATTSGAQASARARHPTGDSGLNLLGKMAGYASEMLSAKLSGLSDAVVQSAVSYVKSAVTNLASSVAAATFGAHATPAAGGHGSASGGAKPADPALSPLRAKLPPIERPSIPMPGPLSFEPASQVPPRRIDQDPGFSAGFDKWVKDNNFEGAKAPSAAAPTPSPAAASKAPESAPAPQARLSRLEQDPGFSAAFDKWVKDNNFESPKTPSAAPTTTPAAAPKLPGSAPQALGPLIDLGEVASKPADGGGSGHKAGSAKTPPAEAAPSAAATSPVQQQPVSRADDPAAMLLNRKQGLSESQSDLLSLMPGLSASQAKPAAAGKESSSSNTAASATAAPEPASPKGQVFTDPRAFARALDQWEKDNHFDYDKPMPDGYVPEPRPELRRPASPEASAPMQSTAEAAAKQRAERDAHQAALDNGYR